MPGEGEIYTTDGRGGISLLRRYNNWRTSWTLIIPGNFGIGGYTDLLFYDSSTGEGEFYTTNSRGGISLLRRYDNWRRSWFWIIPGYFGEGPNTDLLFYDRRAGVGEFYTTDGRGGISLLKRYDNWRKTWDLIIPGNFKAVPGEFGGPPYTDLLFYDRLSGEGEFYSTDGRGGMNFLRRYNNWRTSWSMIIPGHFGPSGLYFTDLLFYDNRRGEGEFYISDGRGGISLLRRYDNWRKTWARIIPANFGRTDHTDLLFYDNNTGEGEFYTTDGRGGINLLRRYNNWRRSWDIIISGDFEHVGATVVYDDDLLFYDNNIVVSVD